MFNDTSNENLSNKGIQVDLSEYLEYKKQFNDTRTISYSSSDLYHKRKKEQEEARSDFFIYSGASAVSAKVLYEKAKKDEGIKALISEAPGAKLLKQKLTKQYLDNQAAQIISGAIDPRSTAVAPLSQSLQSILVSLEELSPSQILKTLQLSSFNSLFVEVIDEERKKARHIKQTSIQVYENYYKNLIFKESKIKLMDEDIKHGFILQNNKLYQAVPEAGNKGEVKAGRVLLDYATVVNSTIKTGDNHHSVNRVFEKFSNIYDANLNRNQLHTEPFVVVGGASKRSTVSTWARAYGRFSLEIGAKSLDNPLGFLEEYLDMTGLNNSKLVKNKYFQTAKGFTNFKLGTGGVYNISSAEMMKKIGKNLAIKGAAGVVGLNIVDATLDALTPDSSVWSNGLIAGMADTFMKAHVKFAELWSDNFQDLKKSQENSAPESTKLSTLIGIPLAGAMTGANIAFFKRMKDTTTKGLEQSSTIHTAEQKLGGLLGKAADKVGINIVGNTLSRYSKVGALLGATLTLPFLPGALVGKSSEELRQEYSGEKEVAVRKDRGWLCMTPDTPIFSSVGYSRAEDIKTGDFLYNRYGTKNKVISVHKRYTKELAYEFKTAYSTNLWTTVTADHKVLTSNGWVPANKINVGDYVVTGIPKLNINSKLLDLASYVNTEKHITETAFFSKQKTRNPAVTVTSKNILCNRYIKIDYQFGLFLGWFLAEGCVSRDKNGKFRPIEISFHKTEENFAIEILEYLNKLTGNTKEIKIYPNQGEGRRIRYSNSILSEFLISFMYRDGVKIFPDLTLFNKECVKGFLIGMFYGDGSITKHKNVRNKFKLKSQYIQHLFEYRRYLSVFGIYGSIYQDRGTGCFILELSGQCSDKANELGLYKELYSYQSISKNFNCRSYYIEDEKVYVKVEKISVYEYEGYVYDYTMENIHEYTPNSFVIHNSGGTEYEGGQIKYFRQNLLKTIASDAKTKTLYGDRETKRRLDPVFNPIKYLRNPYRFEEMHQEDMPFPVWGMDVSYGSVLGQLYKGTIGELIKPTVIHPEFLKLQSEANPNLVLGVKGEIAKGISETISGKNSKNLSQLSAGNGEENSDTSIAIVDSDAYTTPENERKEVKSLIADGLMLRANAPTVSVLDRTLAGTSASLSDFTGLKGFSSSLLLGAANLDPTEQLRPELEVSGSSTSFSDTLSDANLGDMLGCFVPNTKVLTSTGYKEIQNITKGDLVLSKNGVFQKVNEVFEKSFKDIQILKVSLGLGYEDIYCTPDHVFPVIKRVRYSCGHLKPLTDFTVQDLEIGSLETGSLLMLPKNKETKVFDIDLGLTYSGVKTNCYLYPKSKYEKFGELYETLEVDPCSIAKIRPNFSNFEDDNHTYISIKRIEVLDYSGLMYDLNIENTPYYTVNDVLCHNSGEFSRRLIPQSAAVKRDTVNPMRNQVAPDWLPKNETKYYKNFERGNYYCLAPNSLLETNTLEVKKACEIKVGDKLLGKFGKDTVIKNIETIPSQEVLKITINGSNNIPTYLTGEHPVAIRFKTHGESESSEKTKIYRILKLLKNTSKGVSYPKNKFYKVLEVSIPTFSTLFKQMEQEGYIINNKKNIIRTYKDLPDEYLFENNIYFKEAKDLKVGDYVAYPKYREKLDIIEEFDLATIPGWSAISENYVYYTRTPESVIEFEWLRGESNIKPKSNINMSITKENSRDTRKTRFDRYLKLDKNFGLFCGLWLAEGFKKGTAHNVSEYEFVNNIYSNSPLETYQWCPISSTNGAQMRYCCKALDMFLEYTFGSGAKFKHLNNYLLHTPEEFIKGLIEGYYFGDGTTYNNKGRYSETATSASDKLLVQLKLLMIRRLGVVSILNDYKYDPKDVVINGVIKGIDSGYKQSLVVRRQESNSNLWTQDENFYYFRINKIEKEPCNVVYAFETSDNTFCTYSMLTHNSHMENGEYLLPGSKGFETLNPELKGVDPNNYPLVYQYKILQNVARGSSEHIAVKKYLAEHLDELSEKEKDVFFEAYGQDTERDVQKRFTDYKTGSEKSNMGVIGLTQNAIWESFSHLESPLEPLTPFRPMAKFVHQRTAVEDYIKTQLMGSDVGIWTNPYSHFLKPTLNRLADSGSIDQFKPKEAIEKENIDTYFDKLSLVKAIKTNDTYDIERNITALSYLGINDPGSMKRFKSALPEGQSAYVEAFSQEKDKKKRNQILSLVPKDIGRAYQSIWSNIDIYDQAILRGNDPNKALEEEYLKDSKKLKSALSIDITRQDKETIHNQASTLANDEDKKRFEQYQEAKLVRLKAAQKEASEYVENQTGSLPSDNWIGWDPRLTIDDIKLKTLTIGKEDIHRFGYWQKDLERSERLIGLKEGGIVNELENIKAEKRSNVAKEFAIRSRLRNIGFEVSTINSVPSNSNQLKITDKQEYLRAYNNSV